MPTKPLRIAIDVRPLVERGLAVRGIGSYVRNLLAHLFSRDGSNRYLLVYDGASAPPPMELPENASFICLAEPKTRILRRHEAWVSEYLRLSRLLRANRVDVYHATTLSGPLQRDIRRVSTCHDFIPLTHAPSEIRSRWKTWRSNLQYRVFLAAMQKARHVIAISEFTREEARHRLRIPSDRLSTISQGVAKEFRVQPDPRGFAQIASRFGLDSPVVLYVGGADPRKNLPALIQASIELMRQNPDSLQLVVVGSRSRATEKLEAAIAENGLRSRIVFTGQLAQADLVTLYNHARLFCFPSLEEGFGLPVLEAMACGLPVVAYRCPAVEELTSGAACLVDDVATEFRASIRRLLSDDGEWNRLRQAGLARAGGYSWDATASRTLEVYERVAAEL